MLKFNHLSKFFCFIYQNKKKASHHVKLLTAKLVSGFSENFKSAQAANMTCCFIELEDYFKFVLFFKFSISVVRLIPSIFKSNLEKMSLSQICIFCLILIVRSVASQHPYDKSTCTSENADSRFNNQCSSKNISCDNFYSV